MKGVLMPCLLLRAGQVMLPGDRGPEPAHTKTGQLFDVLDVSDQLAERYHRIYVVDLDGVEKDEPQLDYLQEISRETEIWVDAGVRNADQAIDIVVAGAHRTVLSTAALASVAELTQTWKLSSDIAFEVEVRNGTVASSSRDWQGMAAEKVGAVARAVGVHDVIYSPRGQPVDWSVVRRLAERGPTWVDGSFEFSEVDDLRRAGAVGGIFHIHEELGHPTEVRR